MAIDLDFFPDDYIIDLELIVFSCFVLIFGIITFEGSSVSTQGWELTGILSSSSVS